MADEIKISALPAVATPALTDTYPVVQSGVTKKETLTQGLSLVGQQDILMANSKVIKTDTSLGSSFILQAYDVNDAVYRNFITFSANNIPNCTIGDPSGGTLNIDGATIGANSPVTISQSSSITTNALTVNGDSNLRGVYGYRPIVTVSGTSKTFGLSDANTYQDCQNAAVTTLTVPTNASVAFATGTEIEVYQEGAGQVVFAAAGGVTIQSISGNLKIGAQYSGAILKKMGTDTWSLIGNLVP